MGDPSKARTQTPEALQLRPLPTILLAWLLSMGFDFFLHGGLLQQFYARPSGFLLDSLESFHRIPFAYAGFLLVVAGLYWLYDRIGIVDWFQGFRIGLAVGLVVHGAEYLGLYSITTASPALLVAWWTGQAFELGLAGAVVGAMRSARAGRAVAAKVVTAVVLLVVATVMLQSIG